MYEYLPKINMDITQSSTKFMHDLWRKAPMVISIPPTFSARLLDITGICNASGKWGDFTVLVCCGVLLTLHMQVRKCVNHCCAEISICKQASTGFTDECFVQIIKGARSGFKHRLPETKSDIVSYTNISHNNFFVRVVEDQWCDILSFGLMHIWDA